MRLYVQKCNEYKLQTQCFELVLIKNFDTVHGICVNDSQTERRCCVLGKEERKTVALKLWKKIHY